MLQSMKSIEILDIFFIVNCNRDLIIVNCNRDLIRLDLQSLSFQTHLDSAQLDELKSLGFLDRLI